MLLPLIHSPTHDQVILWVLSVARIFPFENDTRLFEICCVYTLTCFDHECQMVDGPHLHSALQQLPGALKRFTMASHLPIIH